MSGDSKLIILGELQLEISLLIIYPLLHTIHLCERSSKLRRYRHDQEHLQHGVTQPVTYLHIRSKPEALRVPVSAPQKTPAQPMSTDLSL